MQVAWNCLLTLSPPPHTAFRWHRSIRRKPQIFCKFAVPAKCEIFSPNPFLFLNFLFISSQPLRKSGLVVLYLHLSYFLYLEDFFIDLGSRRFWVVWNCKYKIVRVDFQFIKVFPCKAGLPNRFNTQGWVYTLVQDKGQGV